MAERLPFVRVVIPGRSGRPDRRATEIDDVLRHGVIKRSHKSETSRDKERRLGAEDSAYFHAGRTHPDYGHLALAIADLGAEPPGVEATPFGLGALLCNGSDDPLHRGGGCLTPVAHEPEGEQRAFVEASVWRSDWRARCAEFLGVYWGQTPAGYFASGADGRPTRSDPAGIFHEARNTDWRAWTVELRVAGDVDLLDLISAGKLLAWAIDPDLESEIVDGQTYGPPDRLAGWAAINRSNARRIEQPEAAAAVLFEKLDHFVRARCS